MDHNDLKLLLLNTGAFAVSMTAVEDLLKLILLIASIVYTVQRSFVLWNRNKDK